MRMTGDTSLASMSLVGSGSADKPADSLFFVNLGNNAHTEAQVKESLLDLVLILWETGYNPALALGSPRVGGALAHNVIDGEVLILNNGSAAGPDAGRQNVIQLVGTVRPVSPAGSRLDLHHNQIARFSAVIPSSVFDPDDNGRLRSGIPCPAQINLAHNVFADDESAFVAGVVNLQANRFPAPGQNHTATVLDDQFLASGNSAPAGVVVRHHSTQTAATANLLTLQVLT
jgi:hypothetical protein